MKIVDRKTFLALTNETLFSKYSPQIIEDILIKVGTSDSGDFYYQDIATAIDSTGSDDYSDKLDAAEKNGISLKMDFDCVSRDGLWDKNQLFLVWEKEDVVMLIDRLKRCLPEE